MTDETVLLGVVAAGIYTAARLTIAVMHLRALDDIATAIRTLIRLLEERPLPIPQPDPDPVDTSRKMVR